MAKSIEEITVEVKTLMDKINQDLKTSPLSKLFNPSPFEKAASALSGFAILSNGPFSGVIAEAVERERLTVEIATIVGTTPEVIDSFYRAHPFSLETIKTAIQTGAKLDEEDIKRTMKGHWFPAEGWSSDGPAGIIIGEAEEYQQRTFIVILPNNERREVKAAYMEVDGGPLYFEDEEQSTILAFGPGHWVWAERIEEEK